MSTVNDSGFPPRSGLANYPAVVYIHSSVYIVKLSMDICSNMCFIMFVVRLPRSFQLM